MRGNRLETTRYYVKKFLRLAPPYWFGIVFYQLVFVAVSALHLPIRIGTNTNSLHVLCNFTMLNNLVPAACNNVVPGGWSISCLWIFFLLFPLWFRFQKGLRHALFFYAASVCVVGLCAVLLVGVWQTQVENNSFWYFHVLTQLPCFAAGMLLYSYEKEGQSIKPWFMLGGFILSASATVWLFFTAHTVAILFLPTCSSLAAVFAYGLLKCCKLKERQAVVKISNVTMSLFIFHPLFTYYGIGYTYKGLERFSLSVHPIPMFILSATAVLLLSYVVSANMESLFAIPMKLYKKKQSQRA